MHPTCRLFKHTCFTLLRSLQDINQPHIKHTENASLIYGDDDDDNSVVVVIVVVDNDDNDSFKNEEKVQL